MFINLYAIDKNSKKMMMEVIIKGSGGFYFKDDKEGADVVTGIAGCDLR